MTEPPRPQFERHVFVCTSGKVCPRQGGEQVHSELRGQVASAGLKDRIRINKSGCVGQCGHGPMIVVYPEGVWYAGVRPEDAREVFEGHLLANRPVERLRYQPKEIGVQICPAGEERIPPTRTSE